MKGELVTYITVCGFPGSNTQVMLEAREGSKSVYSFSLTTEAVDTLLEQLTRAKEITEEFRGQSIPATIYNNCDEERVE